MVLLDHARVFTDSSITAEDLRFRTLLILYDRGTKDIIMVVEFRYTIRQDSNCDEGGICARLPTRRGRERG